MKAQMQHQPQDDQQPWQEARALLAADPAYASWSETSHAADTMKFDAWLKTPAGQIWLDWEEERYEEEHGLSAWEGW